MGAPVNQELFQSIVEIDETYVGGKPRKGHDAQPTFRSKSGAGTKRIPVVGIVERSSGRVSAKVTPPSREGRLTSMRLFQIIDQVVASNAIHMTDALLAYRVLGRKGRIHFSIDHHSGYVHGDVHTNSIESFWALLKRGIVGSYHYVSLKYLQDYVNEFSWRFNNRANKEIFHDYMKRTVIAA